MEPDKTIRRAPQNGPPRRGKQSVGHVEKSHFGVSVFWLSKWNRVRNVLLEVMPNWSRGRPHCTEWSWIDCLPFLFLSVFITRYSLLLRCHLGITSCTCRFQVGKMAPRTIRLRLHIDFISSSTCLHRVYFGSTEI
jgi:hypothetical protein